MDVVATACRNCGWVSSVAPKPIEYKALPCSQVTWPIACFIRGRARVLPHLPPSLVNYLNPKFRALS